MGGEDSGARQRPASACRQAIRLLRCRVSRPRYTLRDQNVTSGWRRSGNRGWRTSPLEPEQDQGTSRRPASRVGDNRGVHLINRAARGGVYRVGGILVLMTGMVVALVACRSNRHRSVVRSLVVCMACRTVSRAVRLATGTNDALGYCPECEKTPQGEPKYEGAPAEDPPLIPHAATLRRRPARRAGSGPIKHNPHPIGSTMDSFRQSLHCVDCCQ